MVAGHEAVDHQLALDGLDGARAPGDRERAGSRPPGSAAGWRPASPSRTTARSCPRPGLNPLSQTSAWMRSRSWRQRSSRPGQPELLDRLDRPVEGHPGHHLRVGEVAARPPHLPDPLVGLLPDGLQELHHRAARAPRPWGAGVSPARQALVHGIEQLAEDVELAAAARPGCRCAPGASPRSRAARAAPAPAGAARRRCRT